MRLPRDPGMKHSMMYLLTSDEALNLFLEKGTPNQLTTTNETTTRILFVSQKDRKNFFETLF